MSRENCALKTVAQITIVTDRLWRSATDMAPLNMSLTHIYKNIINQHYTYVICIKCNQLRAEISQLNIELRVIYITRDIFRLRVT